MSWHHYDGILLNLLAESNTIIFPLKAKHTKPGGAGSEVWNLVYMIAPVKKFCRVRLSTNFPWKNKYGGECRHGRTMSFCSVLSFPAYKYQEKVSMNFFNGPFGHQEAWMYEQFMGDFTYRDSGSPQVQLFLSFVNFRAIILLHLLHFSTYSRIKTLFLILNICYEHKILVWVLQQSHVNVH